MTLINSDDENKEYEYKATIELVSGGNYGYTFRVMPQNEMLLDSENLNLVNVHCINKLFDMGICILPFNSYFTLL